MQNKKSFTALSFKHQHMETTEKLENHFTEEWGWGGLILYHKKTHTDVEFSFDFQIMREKLTQNKYTMLYNTAL